MKRGFTLLEVMISLAILAVALVAISDLNGGAVAMHAYGRRATEATLLLRGKMLDLEDDLQKKGFSDFNDEQHGDFDGDGAPDYSWSAEILKPDVQLDPSQLLSLLGLGPTNAGGSSASGNRLSEGLAAAAGALGAQGGAGGMPGGAALAGGPMAGFLQGQATGFLETLKKSVREVRITVSWRDGKDERSVSASQEIVILPESVGKAGQVQVQPQAPQVPAAGVPAPARPSGVGDSQ